MMKAFSSSFVPTATSVSFFRWPKPGRWTITLPRSRASPSEPFLKHHIQKLTGRLLGCTYSTKALAEVSTNAAL
jgi:hypothetical protein